MNKTENILVVDDTHESLSFLIKLLKEEGYNIFPADSGELALASLENNIPDLILLDINMPGINGFEVCKRIKQNENWAEIPIIFLTAATEINDKLEGLRLGAVDYITKPFQKEELTARLKTHLSLYRYNKLFREQTAEKLIENEKLLEKKNRELKEINRELRVYNEELQAITDALRDANEELLLSKEKAEENEKNYRNLFELNPVSLWEEDFSIVKQMLDKKKNEVDDLKLYLDNNPNFVVNCAVKIKICNVNKITLDLLGVKNKEELIRHLSGNFNEKSFKTFKKELLSIATDKKEFTEETEFIRADGKVITAIIKLVLMDDKKKAIIAITDITDRKEAELKIEKQNEELIKAKEKAEANERKLEEAQQIAHLGHWELDIVNNKLFWSDEIYRIFDLKPQEFGATYEAFLENIHPEDRDKVNNAYTNSLKNKLPYDIEHRLLLATGELKYVQEKCNTQFDKHGNPLRSMGTVLDITILKKTEIELIKAKEKAEKSEQNLKETNKSLQDMVYIASHDLQVPLVSMEGYATELLDNNKDKLDEDGVYCLTRLQVNAQRMHKLVLSLLDISRLNTKKNPHQKFSLSEVIDKILKDISLTVEKENVNISHGKLSTLYGDKQRIEGVFRNLIVNSIIYKGKNINIGFADNIFFVKDDGIGIPESQLEKIFHPGERLKFTKAEGVGMGLTFCKKVIEQHKGKIWAESEGENKGTAIYIKFNSNILKH